ncbi:DRBM domain-containing protein [Pseudomonas jessenii]
MHSRFRVIETTRLGDGIKQYRVVDLVEGGSASKHGVFKARVEAEAVCSLLNAEHPRQSGVGRTSLSL